MKRSLFVATLLAIACNGAALAQYRWVDANGKVNYGDAPPREATDVRSLNMRAAPQGKENDGLGNLPYELRRAAERAPVVLYTSSDCQPCALARDFLRGRGVPFNERTVNSNDDLMEFRRITNGLRLPYVSVGSQTQSAFNPDVWGSMLDAAGYPKGSMLPRSYQWPAPQVLMPPAPLKAADATQSADTPAGQAAAPVPERR